MTTFTQTEQLHALLWRMYMDNKRKPIPAALIRREASRFSNAINIRDLIREAEDIGILVPVDKEKSAYAVRPTSERRASMKDHPIFSLTPQELEIIETIESLRNCLTRLVVVHSQDEIALMQDYVTKTVIREKVEPLNTFLEAAKALNIADEQRRKKGEY